MTAEHALEKAVQAVGGTRAGLARLLGISMQAVSQWRIAPATRVLEIERLTGVSRRELRPDLYPDEPGMAEPRRPFRSETAPERFAEIRIRPDGSAVVPASLLKAAGFPKDDCFTAHISSEGEIRLLTGEAALRYARELVRRSIPEGVDLVEEVLKERRREFEKFEREIKHGYE